MLFGNNYLKYLYIIIDFIIFALDLKISITELFITFTAI
tara:strand:- start:1676 stop:1792 length:117 start_codon:yes stop_codon:yes gene_type:complete